jgi:ATP-dependent DNA ligase
MYDVRSRAVLLQRVRRVKAQGSELVRAEAYSKAYVLGHIGLARNLGLEGIVSKRIGSRYVSGRTRAWLKTKNPDFERG